MLVVISIHQYLKRDNIAARILITRQRTIQLNDAQKMASPEKLS